MMMLTVLTLIYAPMKIKFKVIVRKIILKNASQDADSFGTNICVCYNSLNSLTLPPTPIYSPMSYIKRKGNL